MSQDNTAEDIISKWSNLKSQALQDLAFLMKVQDIKHIVFRGYTPSFNDGDPCTPYTEFIGPPNYIYDDYFVYLDSEGAPKTCYIEDIEEETYEELEEEGVSIELINKLKEALSRNSNTLYPEYPIESFGSFLYNIADIVFDTDTFVLLTLNEEGELDWAEDYYEHGY